MATAKQLAALAKARAARKKNLSAAKKAPKKKVTVKKAVKKRMTNPVTPQAYIIGILSNQGQVGYLAGINNAFDTERSKALVFDQKSADRVIAEIRKTVKGIKAIGREPVKK